ncbi:FAD-dependent oxidoreductase [Nocardia sp. 2]|uniref:FAD-dependent oxidoreductase n=1 Tax=Nocardia acididurans TaxID=2802282 RepID=A0ABS1M6B8_9NOCA|nr:NAD(P)/FAD-dependent oxidoreductase [Nocardia acididurans]MBL1075846.1 FAD-dependent oxidoreductase [Nocardia acididurans]
MGDDTRTRRDVLRMGAVGAMGVALGAAGGVLVTDREDPVRTVAAEVPAHRVDRARMVARDIVGVDEDGGSLLARYQELLGGAGPRRQADAGEVVVVGAGVAGLASAWVLARAGHRVRVLEGADRIGGRIRTLREPFARTGGHGEAGAMRIPTSHTLVTGVLDKLGVATRPFLMHHSERRITVGDVSVTRSEYDRDPAPITTLFGIGAQRGRAILDDALTQAGVGPGAGVREWTDYLARYDEVSLREWLLGQGNSEAHLDYVGSTEGLTARMALSMTHNLMTAYNLAPNTDIVEIVGGTEHLTTALAAAARAAGAEIMTGAEVTAIDGRGHRMRVTYGPDEVTVDADRVLVTAPFTLLRHMSFAPALSYGKRRAIAELHYDAATKTFLEFSERWWPGHGGIDVTDAPPRLTVYPSHPEGAGGVVIASYTWSDDARAWDALPPAERAAECLAHLTEVHGPRVRETWTGGFASHSWASDRWADGEAAVYLPGQAVEIGPDTRTTEMDGRLAFAGDSTSTRGRAWIEGALESAARACRELGVRTA